MRIKKELMDHMLLPDNIEVGGMINQHMTVYRKRKLRIHFLSTLS